jgi:hypothetical protein
MEVRSLPLQQKKAPITLIINVLGAFLFMLGDTIGDTKNIFLRRYLYPRALP